MTPTQQLCSAADSLLRLGERLVPPVGSMVRIEDNTGATWVGEVLSVGKCELMRDVPHDAAAVGTMPMVFVRISAEHNSRLVHVRNTWSYPAHRLRGIVGLPEGCLPLDKWERW